MDMISSMWALGIFTFLLLFARIMFDFLDYLLKYRFELDDETHEKRSDEN